MQNEATAAVMTAEINARTFKPLPSLPYIWNMSKGTEREKNSYGEPHVVETEETLLRYDGHGLLRLARNPLVDAVLVGT